MNNENRVCRERHSVSTEVVNEAYASLCMMATEHGLAAENKGRGFIVLGYNVDLSEENHIGESSLFCFPVSPGVDFKKHPKELIQEGALVHMVIQALHRALTEDNALKPLGNLVTQIETMMTISRQLQHTREK